MNTLQQVIQEKVLQQINKNRVDELKSLTITYSSTLRVRSYQEINENKGTKNEGKGLQSHHLSKQFSDNNLTKGSSKDLDEQSNVQSKKDGRKGQNIKEIETVKREDSLQKLVQRKLISNFSLFDQSPQRKLQVSEDEKRLVAETMWRRKQEYGQKVRNMHLPKIKQLSRQEKNIQEKSPERFEDAIEYNSNYYKKQLQIWNSRRLQDFSYNMLD